LLDTRLLWKRKIRWCKPSWKSMGEL